MKRWTLGKSLVGMIVALLPAATSVAIEAGRPYTSAEVARHKTPDDCWMIVDRQVYDLTAYLSKHSKKYPLAEECGKDVSEGWHTKGKKGKPHSRKAAALLQKFAIGKVADPKVDASRSL